MRQVTEGIEVLSWGGGWGRALRACVSGPFEEETGIRVGHSTHVGLKLPPSLREALTVGAQPAVDLVWSNSVPALLAQRAGWTEPLDPSLWRDLYSRAHPEGHAAAAGVVHPYVVYYVLAYHEEATSQPQTWEILLDPRHRGRIALYPGGNGFYPIAQVLGGGALSAFPGDLAGCWEFVVRLRGQIGELDYSIGMEARLRDRSLDLCFRALPNALAFRAAGLPVGWAIPEEGTTDTVDALWIPRGLPDARREAARRYLEFALRPDVQTRWCAALGAMPVHRSAAVPAIFRGRRDLPEHADDLRGILHIPEAQKVDHEGEWERRFDALITGRPAPAAPSTAPDRPRSRGASPWP